MIRRVLAAAAIGGLVVSVPLAGSPASAKVSQKEDALIAAGFVSRPANTPQRQAMLARLPNKKFVSRVHGDRTNYVYADAKNCNCLYVGSEAAYGQYRRQQQATNIADQQQLAAMDYNDASWNWGAWGPFDGAWGQFGFGPGLGW